MSDFNKPIIVPWDFSEIAEYALQHAVNMAKSYEADIVLAHIVKRKSDIDAAKEKLEKTVLEKEIKYGIKPHILIRDGSIFTVISEIIDETDASFAVMGTHGIKGMQKFTGSWALKVIVGSKVPFIVVQAPPTTNTSFKNVIFPIDFKFSTKEKLIWAEFISRTYNAKFYLVYPNVTDPIFKKKTIANMIIAKRYLTEKGVDFEIAELEGKNISDESIAFAKKIENSMIMISTTRNISFQDYVLGASEQKMIANKDKLPVMCVNPRDDLTRTGGTNG